MSRLQLYPEVLCSAAAFPFRAGIIGAGTTYVYRENAAGKLQVKQFGRICASLCAVCDFACLLAGCVTRLQKTQKVRDLEFTVLDKDTAPEELKLLIEKNKTTPFKLTYADQGFLYIAEGYGAQLTTGYSVEVNGLYETEDAVYIHTNLLGPEKGEETKEITTFPYVVIQLEDVGKNVIFD